MTLGGTMLFRALQLSAIILPSLVFTACGGSSSNNNNSGDTDITGVAATGAAIAGTVFVVDANGEEVNDVSIDENGNFTVDVDGLSSPFLVCAESSDMTIKLCSYSENGEDVNVNPLTNLALYLASGDVEVDDLIAQWSTYSSTFGRDDIDVLIPVINVNFEDAYGNQGIADYGYDFFTEDMEVGDDGFDQVLDHIASISVDETSGVITIVFQNPDTFEEGDSEYFQEDAHVPDFNVTISGSYTDREQQETELDDIEITSNVLRALDGEDIEELLSQYISGNYIEFSASEVEENIWSVSFGTSDRWYDLSVEYVEDCVICPIDD